MIKIANPAVGDSGALTASDELSNMAASNLQLSQPFFVWRTSGLSSLYLSLDLLSAQSVGLAWLGFTNASQNGQWRVRGDSVQANLTVSPAYDSGLVDIWEYSDMTDRGFTKFHATHVLSSVQSLRYWRFDISDAGNTDGYFQAGRLIVCNPWTPSRGIQFGFRPPALVGRSIIREAVSADYFVNRRAAGKMAEFTIRFTDAAAEVTEVYSSLVALDRLRGDRSDALYWLDTEDTDHIAENQIYGHQMNMIGASSPTFRLYEKRYQIKGYPD